MLRIYTFVLEVIRQASVLKGIAIETSRAGCVFAVAVVVAVAVAVAVAVGTEQDIAGADASPASFVSAFSCSATNG